ncbi:MAG TPA: GNAT family N-acetyltransferase [Flavobacteriales bacterium]|nr:GNAT family N-acetyltransferase [Flavobacteriales bacterium]
MRSTSRAIALALTKPAAKDETFVMEVHERIRSFRATAWDAVARSGSVFLSHGYLRALEDSMRDAMGFRYVLFRDPELGPVGVAVLQLADFEDRGSKHGEQACKLGLFKARVRRELKMRALVCGNVFHCGDHGAHFVAGIPRALQMHALDSAMRQVMGDAGLKRRVAVRVFKEHGPDDAEAARFLAERGYHALATDVCMMLSVDSSWKNMDGYLEALTAKARTRLRSITQRSSALMVLELDAEAVRANADRLQRLLNAVLEQSPYVFGRLNVSAYAGWKEHLGEDLMVRGYWLEGELVGFSAAFVNGDCLDAQFVGIDYAHNRQHAIYLRMLVDLLELAIARGLRRVNYGRTSELAKSGLGALPVAMGVHVKLCGRVANKLAAPIIRKVKPSSFELRSPFKRWERTGSILSIVSSASGPPG